MMEARKYTIMLLDGIREGIYDKDNIILSCVNYMSEDDVKDMMECNNLLEEDE